MHSHRLFSIRIKPFLLNGFAVPLLSQQTFFFMMIYLRIGACASGVVVNHAFSQCQRCVERDIIVIAPVAIPVSFCTLSCCLVPYLCESGMPTCSCAGICVFLYAVHGDVSVWRYCSVVSAEDAWIWIAMRQPFCFFSSFFTTFQTLGKLE